LVEPDPGSGESDAVVRDESLGGNPVAGVRWSDCRRYCSVLKSRAGVAVSSDESCLHYFGAGDDYFVSATSDPGAEATPQRLLE
jgi:hypothetical protein